MPAEEPPGGAQGAGAGRAALEQRLRESRGAAALNLAYVDGGLPEGWVALVRAACPAVQELDLSR